MHASFTSRLYRFESISILEILMIRCGLLATLGLLLFANPISAQTTPSPASPPAASTPAADQPEAMEDPQIGDHWTYEVRDEISGDLKSTITHTITDVSPKEIAVRLDVVGKPGFGGYYVYGRSWDLINNGHWRWTPNDGLAMRGPLTVGKSWPIKAGAFNSSSAVSLKTSGTAKVTGKETITTRAGTFDVFKIETSIESRNANDTTKKSVSEEQIWYAPAVDHWVKRTSVDRSEGRVRYRTVVELVEYGRR
jgi:hypothetical protein